MVLFDLGWVNGAHLKPYLSTAYLQFCYAPISETDLVIRISISVSILFLSINGDMLCAYVS
jgi:hypothetical protein